MSWAPSPSSVPRHCRWRGGIDAGLAGIAITQAQDARARAVLALCRCWTGFEMDLNSVERDARIPSIATGAGRSRRGPPSAHPDGRPRSTAAGSRWDWWDARARARVPWHLHSSALSSTKRASIVIDGIDISKIGLDDLRSRLTIIPQDPASVQWQRFARIWDPFDERTDEECLLALRRVNLRTSPINTAAPSLLPSRAGSIHEVPMEAHASSSSSTAVNSVLPSGGGSTVFSLNTKVSEGGSNFSQGAETADLDGKGACCARPRSSSWTKQPLLSTSRRTRRFSVRCGRRWTPTRGTRRRIITIAHRLKTIIDYDRILVMDKGRIAENDSPAALLERKGIFYDMCRKTGEYEELEMLANHGGSLLKSLLRRAWLSQIDATYEDESGRSGSCDFSEGGNGVARRAVDGFRVRQAARAAAQNASGSNEHLSV
ncbi:hypothetical protein L1887_53515 [Cichorium endivia]|nr:hypothetical protein L1887_53515 [Cichorium endivia]